MRWHSPPDWMEADVNNDADETADGGDLLSTRGQLSRRMQKEGHSFCYSSNILECFRNQLMSSLFI